MKDGMFVFDAAIHAFDFRPENQRSKWAGWQAEWITNVANALASDAMPANPKLTPEVLDDVAEVVELFGNSDTDMAMAQTVPLLEYWEQGLSPADLQAEFAAAMPDRVLFCGGVDPIMQGVRGALAEMERQAEMGARSFKFYQAQTRHLKWDADDSQLAYPLYKKALELGVDFVQFHKGGVHGDQNVEDFRSTDVQRASIDWPDLTFGLHHMGDPYFDETFAIASRRENIVLVLPLWFNMYMLQPRRMTELLGKALFEIGPDRLLYGSEAFIWPKVQTYIDAFANLEMPQDLQEGWGYPALTREIKEKIFGLNAARILKIDVEAKKKQLYGDAVAPGSAGTAIV